MSKKRKFPCKKCIVLAICSVRNKVECKPLADFCRSKESEGSISSTAQLKCELIEFSYMTNIIRFIRNKDDADKILKRGIGL